MGIIKHFSDIIAWQKAKGMTLLLYKILKTSKDYSFNDQIKRASISIMNNIAEGFGRYNPREFKQYLSIARGSTMEVVSMILLGSELDYFDENQKTALLQFTNDIDNILKALIIKAIDRVKQMKT